MQTDTSERRVRDHFQANNEADTLSSYRFIVTDDEVTLTDDILYPTGIGALAEMHERGESWQEVEYFALIMLGEIWKER